MRGTPSTSENQTLPQITYVLDTNVLIDYPEIIPNGKNYILDNPSIDLTGAHLVIPSAVVRELANHKKEMSDRGVACRAVLNRLDYLDEGQPKDIYKSYNLENPIKIRDGTQLLSTLPVAKDFKKFLPFAPSETDMDGQIILAALAATYLINDLMRVNEKGTVIKGYDIRTYPTLEKDISKKLRKKVILLTNDRELSKRAHERGIETAKFSCKIATPYTGRRDLTVPASLFEEFFLAKSIKSGLDGEAWRGAMPSEPPLVDNEFLIMYPEGGSYPDSWTELDYNFFSNIGRYSAADDKIYPLKYLGQLNVSIKNPGQAIYAEALMDPNISAVICTGPAGTGKTYMATVYAYEAYKSGNFIGISVVPCQTENSYGYLPGDLNEKLDPNVRPIKRALRNYLLNTKKDILRKQRTSRKFGNSDEFLRFDDDDSSPRKEKDKSLKSLLDDNVENIWKNWFGAPIPIENARGDDFREEIALFDEFQDQNRTQAKTLLTRIGTGGKMIITGDVEQIHAAYLDKDNNGLTFARNLLKGLPGVAQVTFTEDEVIRSPLVQAIIQRLYSPNSSEKP